MVKVTFTLDDSTVARLNETARRLSKPKSEVVREAIEAYHAKSDRLSDAERERMLKALREYALLPIVGTAADRESRTARDSGSSAKWRAPDSSRIIVILLDTSALIDCLTRDRPLLSDLTRMLEQGERMAVSALVLTNGYAGRACRRNSGCRKFFSRPKQPCRLK